jgi:hypothetical protein
MRQLTKLVSIVFFIAAVPAHAAESVVKLKGCEYSIVLPEEPEMREGRPAAAETPASAPSQLAMIRGKVPAFRVECQALDRIPAGGERAMYEDMLDTVASMRLNDLQVVEAPSRLGPTATFTGTQLQAQRKFMVRGTFYLGKRSMMSVITTEWAERYPSKVVTRVYNSIDR